MEWITCFYKLWIIQITVFNRYQTINFYINYPEVIKFYKSIKVSSPSSDSSPYYSPSSVASRYMESLIHSDIRENIEILKKSLSNKTCSVTLEKNFKGENVIGKCKDCAIEYIDNVLGNSIKYHAKVNISKNFLLREYLPK